MKLSRTIALLAVPTLLAGLGPAAVAGGTDPSTDEAAEKVVVRDRRGDDGIEGVRERKHPLDLRRLVYAQAADGDLRVTLTADDVRGSRGERQERFKLLLRDYTVENRRDGGLRLIDYTGDTGEDGLDGEVRRIPGSFTVRRRADTVTFRFSPAELGDPARVRMMAQAELLRSRKHNTAWTLDYTRKGAALELSGQ